MTFRRCLKEPIPEIFEAWDAMSAAVDAHIAGDRNRAAQLFGEGANGGLKGANGLRIWHWLNPAWTLDVDDKKHIMDAAPRGDTSWVPKECRDRKYIRTDVKRAVLDRDGYRCRYCGIPVVDAEIRKIAHSLYPASVTWHSHEVRKQHAGFAVMWLQYDHVRPLSHGGRTDEDNLVVSCALCNFAKHDNTLKQLGLVDPRDCDPVKRGDYDGLERFRPYAL